MSQQVKRHRTLFLPLALVAVGCLCWVHVFAMGVEYWPDIVDVSFGGGSAETDKFNPRGGNIAINEEGTIAVVWTTSREILPPIRGVGWLRLMNGRGEEHGCGRIPIVWRSPGNVKSGSVVAGNDGDFFCQYLVSNGFGSGEPYTIRLQRVDGLGYPLWNEDGVSLRHGHPENPMLVSDAQGGVVLSFVETEQSRFLCQRYHPSGRPMWGIEPIPISIDHGPFIEPVAIPDGFGGIFAFWMDSFGREIFGQHISAEGSRLWGESGISLVERQGDVHSFEHTYFKVIPTSDRSSVIAYESETPITGVPVIRAQKFSELGHPVWQDGIRLDQRPIQQKLGDLTTGPDGSFFYTGSTADDAIISRIGSDGAEQWRVWPLRGNSWSNIAIDYANGVVAVASRQGSFMQVLGLTARGESIPPELGVGTSRYDYHREPVETAVHSNRSVLTLYHGFDKWGDFPPNARGFFWLLDPQAPRVVSGRKP